MNEPQPISSIAHTLVRNTAFNLLSHAIYIVLAFWGIPYLLHGLGTEEFGLLSIVWAVIGYFTLLDFGISRANTKFLAEVLAKNDKEEEWKIIWTSVTSTTVIGIFSAFAVISLAPFFVDEILKIGNDLRDDAVHLFILTGSGIPFMLLFGTFKGFQMARQRFDQVNLFQIGIGVIQWAGSVLLISVGYGLTEIVWLTILSRILITIVVAVTMASLFPGFYQSISFGDRKTLRKIWNFGSWVTVSQIISPLYLYIDRIFIGVFLSLSAVAYYSVSQETLSRLLVVTMSYTTTLFPVMSVQSLLDDATSSAKAIYLRSLKYLVIVLLPVTMCFLLFARDIISLWLGIDFAEKTLPIFQLLMVGLFFNSLAQIPNTVLHAFNRPDIPAKFHLMELPLVIALNIILIPWLGIIGAAIVWSGRVIVDAALHFTAVNIRFRIFSIELNDVLRHSGFTIVSVVLVSISIVIFSINESNIKIVASFILAVSYGFAVWYQGFDENERQYFHHLRQRIVHLVR